MKKNKKMVMSMMKLTHYKREKERLKSAQSWLSLDEGTQCQARKIKSEEVNGFDLSKP